MKAMLTVVTVAVGLTIQALTAAEAPGTNYLAREAAQMRAAQKAANGPRMTREERDWWEAEVQRLQRERIAADRAAGVVQYWKLSVWAQATENLQLRKAAESNRVAQAAADQAAAIRWKESAAINDAKVLAWDRQRAERGEAGGQYDLGMRYLAGRGVTNSPALAREWLSKAAAQGHAKAKAELARLPR